MTGADGGPRLVTQGAATAPAVTPRLIAEVREAVGEALSQANAAEERAGRTHLGREDEEALTRALINEELVRLREEAYRSSSALLTEEEERELTEAVFHLLHGLARIQPLLDDPEVRDIHISGCDRVWLQMRDGRKVPGPAVADSDRELEELIATAARRIPRNERRWDGAHPELNLRLPNGDRLHALHEALAGRPTVTIRRHDFAIHRLDHLGELGMIDEALAVFLRATVKARLNVIVAGGTSTGKTTMLRCLINEIGPEERLITVEDSLELGLEHFEELHPDYEALEVREPNTEGMGAFTLAELVRAALRMDPQRVIVGEVRGAEVLPMLLAMSQGNDGSMCSVHADSSKGVFGRLAMYAAMTREGLEPSVTNLLVANAIDVIVHLGWVGGTRRVTSVREVAGVAESGQIASNELWCPGPDGAAVPSGTPPTSERLAALEAHGFDRGVLWSGNGARRR